MNADFFIHKLQEAKSLISILRGRLMDNEEERIKGAESALEALEKERQDYEQELADAKRAIEHPTRKPPAFQEKVTRESNNRDISAI